MFKVMKTSWNQNVWHSNIKVIRSPWNSSFAHIFLRLNINAKYNKKIKYIIWVRLLSSEHFLNICRSWIIANAPKNECNLVCILDIELWSRKLFIFTESKHTYYDNNVVIYGYFMRACNTKTYSLRCNNSVY